MDLLHINNFKEKISDLKNNKSQARLNDLGFKFSDDMLHIEASNTHGIHFSTSMKKLKPLFKMDSGRVKSLDFYSTNELSLVSIDGFKIIHDKPGHALLVATKRIEVSDLIKKLEIIVSKTEKLGSIMFE